ncbi:MAG: FAD-dependent oxidoreductase [Rhizobiales bacterium]|nr:FAD-dependent oxidoreductase [Hyphomicrobiales bacterium]
MIDFPDQWELLSALRIGKAEIPNRIMMPALHLNYHRDFGYADDTLIAFYEERARGRAGLISIGGFAIDVAGAGVFDSLLLGLWDNSYIPDLKRLTGAMKAANPQGKVACQLYHTGRVSPSKLTGRQPVAVSPIPSRFNPEPLHILSTDEVKEVERKYVDAAVRAVEAGFDMIDLFCGTGHLLNQFLSPATNEREDEYGGSCENRARVVTNIVRGINNALPDIPVLARLAGHDLIPGGNTHHDVREIARLMEQAGVAAFNVTGGWHESRVPQITGEVPTGAFVWLAQNIKSVVSVPVAASNRINDPAAAERIIREGRADFISMGRPLLADPHLPRKLIEKRADQITHCIACNVCLDSAWHGPTRCLVNPRAGRELELQVDEAAKPRKVLVVGGGPGGMMAAKIAAARGHSVVLFERETTLGGVAGIGAVAPGKKEYRWLYEDLARQVIAEPRIAIKAGVAADLATVREESPAAVLIATGGRELMPDLPGQSTSGIRVCHAHDVLAGKAGPIGRNVVVIGGGPTACETALLLKEEGGLDGETVKFLLVQKLMDVDELRNLAMCGQPDRTVTIVQRSDRLAKSLNKSIRWTLLKALEQAGVQIRLNAVVSALEEGSAVLSAKTGDDRIPCDTIIVAAGIAPENELYQDVKNKLPELPVYLIGDAVNPRQATEALLEAFQAAIRI